MFDLNKREREISNSEVYETKRKSENGGTKRNGRAKTGVRKKKAQKKEGERERGAGTGE